MNERKREEIGNIIFFGMILGIMILGGIAGIRYTCYLHYLYQLSVLELIFLVPFAIISGAVLAIWICMMGGFMIAIAVSILNLIFEEVENALKK